MVRQVQPIEPKRSNWKIYAGMALACVAVYVVAVGIDVLRYKPPPEAEGPAYVSTATPTPTPKIKALAAKPKPTATPDESLDDLFDPIEPKKRVPSAATRPERSAPAGASARCRDGTYSYSQNRRGTCSHHGGVAEWL